MDDIKASYEIAKVLRTLKIPFVLLKKGDSIPNNVCAFISREKSHDRRAVLYEGNAKKAVLKAISVCKGRECFEEVVIGIDPGSRVGMVVLADGDLMEARAFLSYKLEEVVKSVLMDYPAKSFIFKIGKGEISQEVISIIKEDVRARVEFVDEEKLPIPPKYRIKGMKRDLKSALIIALSKSFR